MAAKIEKKATEKSNPFTTLKMLAAIPMGGKMEVRLSVVKVRDRIGLDVRKFSGPGKDAFPFKGLWMEVDQWADVAKAMPKAIEAARKVK